MASPGNQDCAICIGTLSFPIQNVKTVPFCACFRPISVFVTEVV